MKMKKIYFLIAMLLLTVGGAMAQDKAQDKVEIVNKAFDKTSKDSSYIAVNKQAGWQSVISHLTLVKTDSVLLELVVRHDRTSIDWKQEQPVGRIKQRDLLPKTEQIVLFKLIRNIYRLRIEPNGRCFIRLEAGILPKGDQVIIPVRGIYKKN
jgi:hypothetical protein